MILTIFLTFTFVVMVLFIIYEKRKYKMNILNRCGIPGPKPHIIWGNMEQYYSMPNVLWDSYLVEKYGPITGYYLGAKPFILIADPKLLYKIEKENSHNFLERPRKVPGGINPDPKRALMLGNLPVPEWKHVRKILSPTFSPTKLKDMLPEMVCLTNILVEQVKKKAEGKEQLDLYKLFQALTLDIIGSVAFGAKSNIQNNPEDPLLKAVMEEFSKNTKSTLVKLYLCFPEISFLLQPLRKIHQKLKNCLGYSESSALWSHGREALMKRSNQKHGGYDLIQQLIKSNLSTDQIVANSVLFFEAAYETLSGSLGFIIHLLVKYPEIQEKLYKELDDFVQENGTLDSYKIKDHLKYLDSVINEGLRLLPPQTTFIGRAPLSDFEFVKDSHKYILRNGIHIQVALYQTQNSTTNWPDHNSFNPERDFKNNPPNQLIWQPFGYGPRRCIGEQFALLTLKLILSKIIYNYRLVPCTKSEETVTIEYKVATMTPLNGSWALPIPRQHS